MNIYDEYDKIPCELSGSMSKNRFRLEMLWGASKMFDLFDQDDFCVVFDYKCDVEIHLPDSIEFYQVKSHKIQSPYLLSALSKMGKAKDGTALPSILGKLFLITNAVDKTVKPKVAIVSNAFLKIDKKVISKFEEICLDSLDDAEKKKIRDSLKSELGCDADLSNVYFLYTSMNLLKPENDLCGKIVGSFEKIMGCEPKKPNALYRLIKETVEQKACYELTTTDYKELILKKGITKQELQTLLNMHAEIADTSIDEAKMFIENNFTDIRQRRKYKASLVLITEQLFKSSDLRQKEKDVADYLDENQDMLPDNQLDTLEMLHNEFHKNFPIEYSESDIKVFLMIVMFKWEDGKYE